MAKEARHGHPQGQQLATASFQGAVAFAAGSWRHWGGCWRLLQFLSALRVCARCSSQLVHSG